MEAGWVAWMRAMEGRPGGPKADLRAPPHDAVLAPVHVAAAACVALVHAPRLLLEVEQQSVLVVGKLLPLRLRLRALAPLYVLACGVWRVACGVWRVACGVWRVARGVWRGAGV